MELCESAGTLKMYPRRFSFRAVYELDASTLADGLRFEDYRLRFSEPCEPLRVGFTPDCFINGEDTPYPLEGGRVIPLTHSFFDSDAIVLRNMSREVTLETPLDGHGVTVSFPDMTYLGIWHAPRTDAPYVCIEPWLSLPARAGELTVFERRADLARLGPGQIFRRRWTVTVK